MAITLDFLSHEVAVAGSPRRKPWDILQFTFVSPGRGGRECIAFFYVQIGRPYRGLG